MLNVAILGCGRWGSNHLRVLSELKVEEKVKKIFVIDTSQEARDNAVLADETESSIDGVPADLVIIATPSELHSSQAVELIEKGYHVLVEKPLGNTEFDAAAVISTAQEHGRLLSVGLLLRHHPAIRLVQNLISTGKIGRLESLRFVRRSTRQPLHGSNVIESLGVHGIDLLCHLLGEVEPSAISVEGDEIESRIVLEFPHGIEGLIDVAWNATKENRSVSIMGSNGKLIFDLNNHDSVFLYKDGNEYTLQCDDKFSPLEAEIRHMLDGINAFNQGTKWSQNPSYGAVLRGVRWTEKAIAAMPHLRPH
ncbi:MAG: Gfo/Idh/MocA family protein [Candidatus Poseidoniaceae archaeon]